MVRPDGHAVHLDRVHVVGVGDRAHDPVPVPYVAPAIEVIADRRWRALLAE